MAEKLTFDELSSRLGGLNARGDDEDQLIIGFDFGTTFSGISYIFTSTEKKDPISILDWPGNKGRSAPKTPTVLSYGPDKKSFTWGYELDQTSADKIEGIKLLLDPDMPKPLYIPHSNTRAELNRLGKPPISVASDYIGAVYKHALSQLQTKWPADYLAMLQKKFVLTVPAVWSDKAKDSTLRAAKAAGIYPVTLIKEPEAAALYTLHYLKGKALAVGDAFVLCDAGGGTVDLISYEITNLAPLELKELVPGKGGLAGSLMLNKRFEQEIKDIVGEEDFVALRKTRGFRQAMKQFDQEVKTAYNGSDDDFLINFPMSDLKDNPACGISKNCFHMKRETLDQIFSPLVNDIQKLVDEQVNLVRLKRLESGTANASHIKAIFLVGGFGSSVYLKECLQRTHQDIQVIQPTDAWSAIVKGAVLSQLPQEAVVVTRCASRHYGVQANCIYKESEHAGEPKIWDSYEQVWRVAKMTWYILEGDDLEREQKIVFPFYRTISKDASSDLFIFEDHLIQSDAIKPPDFPRPNLVKPNCTLKSDLRKIPKSEFKLKKDSEGKEYYEVHYNLAVTTSGIMTFALEMNGKTLGQVEAQYD